MKECKVKLAEGERVDGEVVTIYAAIASTYEESHVASYHLTQREAVIGASRLGYVGVDGEVRPVLALRLVSGHYALAPEIIEISENPEAEAKLREQALQKLTPAERAALMSRPGK